MTLFSHSVNSVVVRFHPQVVCVLSRTLPSIEAIEHLDSNGVCHGPSTVQCQLSALAFHVWNPSSVSYQGSWNMSVQQCPCAKNPPESSTERGLKLVPVPNGRSLLVLCSAQRRECSCYRLIAFRGGVARVGFALA